MTTFERVKDIVVEKLGIDPADVTDDAQLIDDLGADSLDIVETVMDFEAGFNIEIPDEAAEKFGDMPFIAIVEYIGDRIGEHE